MPASLTLALVECAPGNTVQIAGAGLLPGAGASVSLGEQIAIDPTGASAPAYTGAVAIAATFATTSVAFVVPDGVTTGTLTVTAGDGSIATCALRVDSQYVQAAEFIGEGVDLSDLAGGELDTILRDASGYIDTFLSGDDDVVGMRLLQTVEHHKFKAKFNGPPRFWPRRRPVVSLDAIVFVTSNQIRTKFNVSQSSASDVYVNPDLKYFEILAYAFGNYALLGAIETVGFSANVVELAYTAGYPMLHYPRALRKATKMVATELLTYRGIQSKGLGGLSSVKEGNAQYDRRSEAFEIPLPAKELLRPFIGRRLG